MYRQAPNRGHGTCPVSTCLVRFNNAGQQNDTILRPGFEACLCSMNLPVHQALLYSKASPHMLTEQSKQHLVTLFEHHIYTGSDSLS